MQCSSSTLKRQSRQRQNRRGNKEQEIWQYNDENVDAGNKSNTLIEATALSPLSSCPKWVPTSSGLGATPAKMGKREIGSEVREAQKVLEKPEYVSEVMRKLEDGSPDERHSVLMELEGKMFALALSKSGCFIVQKALDVALGSDRDMIWTQLKDDIFSLYESPHGNHVLIKAIQVLPSAKVELITSALVGRCTTVARHRFGCRVVCRLIEYCKEDQISALLDELTVEADTLARHAFGNYVVQTALEHLSPFRRSSIVQKLLPKVASLAMQRCGSLVIQRIFDYCNDDDQAEVLNALLQDSNALVDASCNHFGSFVIEQIAAVRFNRSAIEIIKKILTCNLGRLLENDHAQRVINAFELAPSAPPCLDNQ
jgi:pumilio RNA-binding family